MRTRRPIPIGAFEVTSFLPSLEPGIAARAVPRRLMPMFAALGIHRGPVTMQPITASVNSSTPSY